MLLTSWERTITIGPVDTRQEGAAMINRIPHRRRARAAAFLLILSLAGWACSSSSPSPAIERTQVLADWEDLRFGMFVHFGMSTFTGYEFGEFSAEAKVYAPTALDVDQWIRVAREGGMKYAVLTTKHCYGHALWNSRLTDYDVGSGPVKTDVVRAFVDACRKFGVKPGFYYLLGWDKVNQWARTPVDYEAFCRGQIEELLTGYGPITEIWLDIPWDMGPDTEGVLKRLYAKIKSLQPDCLVLLNQSFVDGSAVRSMPPTYAHREFDRPPVLLWPKDINNGEVVPPPAAGHDPRIAVRGTTYYMPMETCDTLAHHWFWEAGDALKSVRTLVRIYRSTVDRGANLLLDLAPDRTGRIPEATAKRLMEMKAALANPSLIPPSLTFGAPATASSVYQNDKEFEPGRAVDDDSNTRWAADEAARDGWLEIDLGASREFDGAYLSEGWDRVRSFVLETRESDGKPWNSFCSGTTIGTAGLTLAFPRTRGRHVRLHVLEASGGPSIWDFELYEAPPAGTKK
jgi:alpha-L-fucosidase